MSSGPEVHDNEEAGQTESARRAQRQADTETVNEDDEREAAQRFAKTGEPERDRLGNASGAS